MLYLNHNDYAIELREAPEPWGPWSDPIEVLTGLEAPGLYGSYMNPLYVENGGETIYFTMSLWNPYDVYVVKATLGIVPEPSSLVLLASLVLTLAGANWWRRKV